MLFDSHNALLGQGGTSTPGNSFAVLRDWVGHIGEGWDINFPEDFTWSNSDHVASANLLGPYGDVSTQVYYESGTDALEASCFIDTSTEDKVEIAGWVKFDDVPTPGVSAIEQTFMFIENTATDARLEVRFVYQTDGSIDLKGVYSNDGITEYSYTHPDSMASTGWVFFAAQFDHTALAADRIYLDPGNDNVLGNNPGPAISATSYNYQELMRGPGQSPGNVKGVRFSGVLLIRVPPTSGTAPADVVYTTPGADTFVVPTGVTSATVTMWSAGGGGGGGGSDSVGGSGRASGFTKATHTTTPAETLDVYVGGAGSFGTGGSVSGSGGGGGGRSWVKRSATHLQVTGAGAGGGGGDNSSFVAGGYGGAGGASTGETGFSSGAAQPGTGGTQVAGGSGGTGNVQGDPGSLETGGGGGNGEGGGKGGTGNGGTGGGGSGGIQSSITLGFGGGGGGGAGYYGGGGGGSSTPTNAGGGGGGGGSNYIIAGATSTTSSRGVGTTPPGTGDPLYSAPAGQGGTGGPIFTNGSAGQNGRVVISYMGVGTSWRAVTRGFSTQEEFDEYVVEEIKPVRFWRCSEWDLGSGQGDRYVHDISGFLNGSRALGGTLDRGGLTGPLDTNASYLYRAGCTATTEQPTKSLFYAAPTTWDLTFFTFFKQPAAPLVDSDWFVRIENDAGEYIQLERTSTTLTRRVQLATGPPVVDSTAGTPLFDGSWHRLALTASNATAANWDVAVDGTRYLPDVTPQSLSAPITKVRWGNIDVDLALTGWANYFDPEIYTTFTSQATEFAVRSYIQARTDTAPAGTEYYLGYYPQQDAETGVL